MAEDHSLADGDAAVDVAEGSVLLLPAPAHEEVLPDLYHDGVGNDLRGERPHSFLEGGREQQHLAEHSPLNANALTGEALSVDHDVGLIQHEHVDLLQVHDSPFETPVQHCPRGPDDDLLLQRGALQNCQRGNCIRAPPNMTCFCCSSAFFPRLSQIPAF
uniref:Uncharacterized protein n=1 Tax=Buteo japonicus TaxID=224669 RepID=A0A8C0AWI1_9AVES